jgi:hypothetical protein
MSYSNNAKSTTLSNNSLSEISVTSTSLHSIFTSTFHPLSFRNLFKDQSKDNDTISHIYDSIVLSKDGFDAKYEDGTIDKDDLTNFFIDNV